LNGQPTTPVTFSDVVRTFRSARHGRPEGLHYSGDQLSRPGDLTLKIAILFWRVET
jgi:hypothetical protein